MARRMGIDDLKSSSKDEEKREEYFTGGINRQGGGSGLAVEGPPSGRSTRGGVFDKIVQNASSDPSSLPPGENPSLDSETTITLYRNGFIVNDGPLRDLTSPANQAFIQSLENGDVPLELRRGSSKDVYVKLADKREEDYVSPAYIAFSGTGTTLGLRTPGETFVFLGADLEAHRFTVDDSQPTTTLQIRLSNGQKLRVKMNNSQTVFNLAHHIHSTLRLSPFTLSAGFPQKGLEDPHASLTDAGLLGASVTHKTL